MPSPLVDIDANPRQPNFKLSKEGSKIPYPPKVQRSGDTDRHSPFSVSTTGSPCYAAPVATSKASMPHAPTSKLPRKSTPTQSAFSKSYTYGSRPVTPRLSLPRARGAHQLNAMAVPSNMTMRKTSPPLSCDKPLPSPPIAQVVNSASPPKAQRTLVDAEAGTPTSEQWPILRPEDTSLQVSPACSLPNSQLQRSISEGSGSQRNNVSFLSSRVITPGPTFDLTSSRHHEESTGDDESSNEKSQRMTDSHILNSMNPYAQPFHAVSTITEVALDSPLAQKQQTTQRVIIPPRLSSKRGSLSLPGTQTDRVPTQPSSAFSKPGSTKWPILTDATNDSPKGRSDIEDLTQYQHRLVAEPEPIEPLPSAGTDITRSHYGSIDSVSTKRLGAGLSRDDSSETHCENSFRVKRLSWQSANPGSGPTLRIFANADAIILGQEESIPTFPTLSEQEQVPEHNAHERLVSTLTGRVSKQTLVTISPSANSRTSTPSAVHTEPMESRPVKISPIRSMQPPRNSSTGDIPLKSASASTQESLDASMEEAEFVSPQTKSLNPFETTQCTLLSQPQFNSTPQGLIEDQEDEHSSDECSVALQGIVSQEPSQVLDTDAVNLQKEAWKRPVITEMISGSASPKSTNTRSKISPFLPSSERLRAQVSLYSSRSPSLASSKLTRSTAPHAGVRQPGPVRRETQGPSSNVSKSTSKATEAAEKSAEGAALKMKAKRSFRDIFQRRTPGTTPQRDKKRESNRTSVTGSALAQRFRESTNFSRISLVRPSVASSGPRPNAVIAAHNSAPSGKNNDCLEELPVPEPPSTASPPQSISTAQYDTVNVVHKILDRVTSMSDESPDRLQGLEVAEAILHTVEYSQKANLSAELAKKHARDAQLHAERASLELTRLAKLCEPNFDSETMQSIQRLIIETGSHKLTETDAE